MLRSAKPYRSVVQHHNKYRKVERGSAPTVHIHYLKTDLLLSIYWMCFLLKTALFIIGHFQLMVFLVDRKMLSMKQRHLASLRIFRLFFLIKKMEKQSVGVQVGWFIYRRNQALQRNSKKGQGKSGLGHSSSHSTKQA